MIERRLASIVRRLNRRPRQWHRWLIVVGMLAAAPVSVLAQQSQGTISVIQPAEWSDGNRFTATAGQTVSVRGLVSHPSGVLRVLVNGEEAFLRRNPNNPNEFTFDRDVAITAGMSAVTITLVPRTGEQRTERFGVEIKAAPVQPTAGGAGEGPRTPVGNPWGGFKTRGIFYGVGAAGGVVLTMLKKSETSKVCAQQSGGFDCVMRTEESPAYLPIGAGLVAGAVVLTVVDGLLTSRKASAAATSGEPVPNGGLNAPAFGISPAGRVELQLIRLRF